MKIISLILSSLFITVISLAQPFAPVNKNASSEARKLLAYLYSINGKYILSGEHNYNETMSRFDDSVTAITGKQPAVWGTDFIWNGTKIMGKPL